MSHITLDPRLGELLEHARRSRISLGRALELAQPQFPNGRIVKAQPRVHGEQRTFDALFLIEVHTEKGLMLMPKEVRVDTATAKLTVGDPEELSEQDARAIVVGFPNFSRDLRPFDEVLSTGERDVNAGVPVEIRVAGRQDRPELHLTLVTGEDAVTLGLDAATGQVLARAAWRESLRAAGEAFRRFESLGREFDARCAESYADDATIRNERRMPDGQTRKMEMTGADFKKLIAPMLVLAKERGDRNTFRDVEFRMEGCAVRVRATRLSESKGYESPIDWLFASDERGRWRIVEENSVSRP